MPQAPIFQNQYKKTNKKLISPHLRRLRFSTSGFFDDTRRDRRRARVLSYGIHMFFRYLVLSYWRKSSDDISNHNQ